VFFIFICCLYFWNVYFDCRFGFHWRLLNVYKYVANDTSRTRIHCPLTSLVASLWWIAVRYFNSIYVLALGLWLFYFTFKNYWNYTVTILRFVLLVQETGIHTENHSPCRMHTQNLSHNVVSSTLIIYNIFEWIVYSLISEYRCKIFGSIFMEYLFYFCDRIVDGLNLHLYLKSVIYHHLAYALDTRP
jgi:hypothetical protein